MGTISLGFGVVAELGSLAILMSADKAYPPNATQADLNEKPNLL